MKPFSILLGILGLVLVTGIPVSGNDDFETVNAELVDRAVVMQLPEGVRRVRVRILNGEGLWETCTIAHLKGTEGYLKLRLPDGIEKHAIQVAASWTDPFPFEFYSGKSKFDPTQTDSNTNRDLRAVPETVDGAGDETTVEESDIWKWRGSTLYFFNQYRGLQVVDVSDPATPTRLASLRIPFSGEQLYLHPTENTVVLLTYDGNSGNGQVLLVEHGNTDELVQQAAIPVPGYIVESRLVGDILYVVSRQWWQESAIDSETQVEHIKWQSGLTISKIDLNDPANPKVAEPLNLISDRYDYWGAQVQATPEALLISTNAYDPGRRQSLSTVHVIDISDPLADPFVSHQFSASGQVLNKFNLQLKDQVLTVVSQVWRGNEERRRYASVETFDVSQPFEELAKPLAQLEFANNESITASRFSGDLLYVVTVLRIDPLFVISLSDPANPQLLGELEVPGFSTHLETLGEDSLISVGVEGSQVAVSWFDVSNPAEPELASRVYVGAEDGWSWTEANWDEKAFGFFPDDGLILLPYQGSVPEVGWTSGVQIIELSEKELIKRGAFEHEFQARRARVLNDAVVSISGRSLKALDIADPDNPLLLADLTLAWPADFVHRSGDYLLQLERGPGYWFYGSNDSEAHLHVSRVEDTDDKVASLKLPAGRIVGSLLLNNCLIVAQSNLQSSEDEAGIRTVEVFTTTLIDLSNPLDPKALGAASDSVSQENNYHGFGADYKGELLPDGALVWYPAEQNFYYFLEPGLGGVDARASDFLYPYFPSSGRIYSVDIENKEEPRVLSSTHLLDKVQTEKEVENFWPEGTMHLLGSTLFFGLQTSEFVERKEQPSQWMARHWLGQLDLANPANPQKRELIEIPGTFENVINNETGGLFLFSSTFQSFYDSEFWRTELRIQALAFDGLQAFLIDELAVQDQGYGPKLFSDQFIVLGKTDYSSGEAITGLTTYEWLHSGSFQTHQTLQQPGAIYRLGIIDDLLVAPGSGDLSFIDFRDPTDPARTTLTFPNVNFWQRIELIDVYEREAAYLPLGWYGVQSLGFDGVFSVQESELALPSLQADFTPEWMDISLDLLTLTSAGSDLILGDLSTNETWLYAEAVEQYGYENWMRRTLELGAEEPVPMSEADSDGDGLSNAWEYFSGTHPGDLLDGVPVESWITEDSEGKRYINLRMVLNLHATESLSLVPQYSENFLDWEAFPDAFEISAEAFNPARIVRYLEPIGSRDKLFIRLSLSSEQE